MDSFPREYLGFAERLLREHPARLQEMKVIENTIAACCNGPAISDTRNESLGDSRQERILIIKDNHLRYQSLLKQINAVNHFIASLSDQEKKVFVRFFWKNLIGKEIAEELHLDESWVRKIKARILKKALKAVIPTWAA